MGNIISSFIQAIIGTIVLYIIFGLLFTQNFSIFANSFFTSFGFIVMFAWVFWELMTIKL